MDRTIELKSTSAAKEFFKNLHIEGVDKEGRTSLRGIEVTETNTPGFNNAPLFDQSEEVKLKHSNMVCVSGAVGRPSIKFKKKSELNEDFYSSKSVISIKGENDYQCRLSVISKTHAQKEQQDKSGSSLNLNEGLGETFTGGRQSKKQEEEDPFVLSQNTSALVGSEFGLTNLESLAGEVQAVGRPSNIWHLPYEERKSLIQQSSKQILNYNHGLMMTIGAQQLKQMQLGAHQTSTPQPDVFDSPEDDGFGDTDLDIDDDETDFKKMSIKAFNTNMMSDVQKQAYDKLPRVVVAETYRKGSIDEATSVHLNYNNNSNTNNGSGGNRISMLSRASSIMLQASFKSSLKANKAGSNSNINMFGIPIDKQNSGWSETDFGNVDEHSICLPQNIFAGYNNQDSTPGKLRSDLSFKYKPVVQPQPVKQNQPQAQANTQFKTPSKLQVELDVTEEFNERAETTEQDQEEQFDKQESKGFGEDEDEPEVYTRPSQKLQPPNKLDQFVTKVPQQDPVKEEGDKEDEDPDKSNIADLHKQHFEHTKQALQFITTGMTVVPASALGDRFVNLPEPWNPEVMKKVLIFDMDETLIHCVDDIEAQNPDVILEIDFPGEETVCAGINIRPYVMECLQEANKSFQVIVFTASHQTYADAILDYLDPQRELIQYRMYRQHCLLTPEGYYVKDLRVIANREMKDLVIVDNSVYSFAYQINNGIPIIPFYDDTNDEEMLHLIFYLNCLATADDVRDKNKEAFELESLVPGKVPIADHEENSQIQAEDASTPHEQQEEPEQAYSDHEFADSIKVTTSKSSRSKENYFGQQ